MCQNNYDFLTKHTLLYFHITPLCKRSDNLLIYVDYKCNYKSGLLNIERTKFIIAYINILIYLQHTFLGHLYNILT
jgi:hypothetical protein